jgi:cytochrome c-type biogenesis protein CcmH
VRRSVSAAAIFVLLAAFVAPSFAKPRDPAHEITSQLICPCSCGEVLSGCTCETGKSMQATVENGIKAGKDKKAIVGALVSQYGEVIRGAPKAEGFNLIVWVAPFAATLAGFAIAFWILRRWVSRRAAMVDAAAGGPDDRRTGRTLPFSTGRSLEADAEALRQRAEEELREMRQRR